MLILAFVLSFVAVAMQGIIIPKLSILAFSPFLALIVMRCELNRLLWLSVLAGSIMDLLSEDPMGLHALNYAAVSALLFRVRRHFSYDQPLHLSLLTALVSFFSTILQLMLLFLFDRKVPFDAKWTLVDWIGMPILDGLYAFVWFAAPLLFFEKIRRMWQIYNNARI